MSPIDRENCPTLTASEANDYFLLSYDGDIPTPLDVDGFSSAEAVICEDAKATNVLLKFQLQALRTSMSIKTLCGLSLTILKTLEARRKLLLLPIQAPVERDRKFTGEGEYLVPFNVEDNYDN